MPKRLWPWLLALMLAGAAPLQAAVPARVNYQGRLHKSGVAITGAHTFVVRLLSSGGTPLWSSGPLQVNVPATGDFSLTFEPAGVDWEAQDPRFEVTVDGETLSPTDTFSATPYSFLAQDVADGSVDTAELAAGAVTDAKVTAGVLSSKILLENSSPSAFLSSWQSTTTPHLIDGAKVAGTVLPGSHGANHVLGQGDAIAGLDRTQVSGTALLAFSTFTQLLEPTDNVLPLRVKSRTGSNPSTVHIMEWQGESGGTEMLLRGTGDLEVGGRIKDVAGFVTPAGAVLAYAGASAPAGWLLCDGSAVSRAAYADLFTAIGTAFGVGDGVSTFNVPDMRGRAPIGAGQGSGLTDRLLAASAGAETHTLTTAQIPAHNHGITDSGHGHGVSDPGHAHTENGANAPGGVSFGLSRVNYDGNNGGTSNTTAASGTGISIQSATTGVSVQNAGSGSAHSIMQPSLVLNFIIKT